MDFKKLLLSVSLALLTTLAIQYFIMKRSASDNHTSEVRSGQTFTAPQSVTEAQPLNREVDFLDSDRVTLQPAVQTVIQTPHAIYRFSNHGACLEQLTFKRRMEGHEIDLNTIETPQQLAHAHRCFMVALDQKTPYLYQLTEQKQLETARQLVYRAETDQVIIEKTYTVYEQKFQIDLNIAISPKNQTMQARIFFGAPYMREVKDDIISAIYNTEKGKIEKESRANLDLNKGWFMPTVFGSDNRYFVHALVSDQQGFARRAYYAVTGKSDLISILESAPIAQKTDWNLSFYFGPKEDAAINAVEPRLEQTLDYSGWLAPLSRLLLMILKYLYSFVHNYGWAIVLMTLLINLILLPLNIGSAKSMKKYTEFQKKLAYIQQRYKDDPDTLARERSDLINKHGMPGLGGCLPKLLQLPIFFALSRVLSSSIELYKAPFLWIQDLSAADPFYILPILIAFCMIIQSNAADPKQRLMVIAIAIIFGIVSMKFSAGLCLYIFIGVLLNGIQVFVQQKMNWA